MSPREYEAQRRRSIIRELIYQKVSYHDLLETLRNTKVPDGKGGKITPYKHVGAGTFYNDMQLIAKEDKEILQQENAEKSASAIQQAIYAYEKQQKEMLRIQNDSMATLHDKMEASKIFMEAEATIVRLKLEGHHIIAKLALPDTNNNGGPIIITKSQQQQQPQQTPSLPDFSNGGSEEHDSNTDAGAQGGDQ